MIALTIFGLNPLLNAPVFGKHGLSKSAWVTLWLFAKNKNSTTSPMYPVTDSGLYLSTGAPVASSPPTITLCVLVGCLYGSVA